MRAAAVAFVIALGIHSTARADDPDALVKAKNAFQYGDFSSAIEQLSHYDIDGLPTEDQRIDAYKVLGLSYYFSKKPNPVQAMQLAGDALFGLLRQNPDYKFDPLYVPPDACSFLDEVRRARESSLADIRKFRRARLLEQQKEDEARKKAQLETLPIKIQRFSVSSPVVAILPFGLGQFQNGNVPFGIGLAVGEGSGAAMSILSFLMVEVLRDSSTQEFKGSNYQLAQGFNIAKWVGVGVFYGLWLAGGIEAVVHYVPRHQLPDGPPSAAPAGTLPMPPPHTTTETPSAAPR